jgi:hypothetical protein
MDHQPARAARRRSLDTVRTKKPAQDDHLGGLFLTPADPYTFGGACFLTFFCFTGSFFFGMVSPPFNQSFEPIKRLNSALCT